MNNYYLSFSINNHRYCINLSYVKEIFYLPELKKVPELPADIVGVFNYHNTILPVVDLNVGSDYTSSYSLTDSVIAIAENHSQVGIIVNQVHGIIEIAPQDIATELFNLETTSKEQYLFTGIANVDSDILVLSNPIKILQYINQQSLPSVDSLKPFNNASPKPKFYSSEAAFFAKATQSEKSIFQERARSLAVEYSEQNERDLVALAIVELHGELLGIELEKIREFIRVAQITPIPNVASFLVGNINLRGEIITLLDITQILSINSNKSQLQQAAIVEIEDIVVGINLSQIVNIMFVDSSTLQTAFQQAKLNGYEYIKGNITEQNRVIKILNLDKIIKSESIVADQAA
jgi:purine-binding chemotaxis protein CheW